MNNKGTVSISGIKIKNFKIFKQKEFTFDNDKLILITGANGFGKSTLIDAIEWCLTGNIKRIQNRFEDRNTSKSEKNRVDNRAGIIKNINSKKKDKIKVTLKLKVNGVIIEVYREQNEDNLNCFSELIFPKDLEEELKDIVKNSINKKDFYKYHVCDTYKSYDFLTSSRPKLLDIFSDFLKDRSEISNTINNLENFSEVLTARNKEEIIKITTEEVIKSKEKKIEDLKGNYEIPKYPQQIIFKNEILNIEKLGMKDLKIQLDKLHTCAYNNSKILLERILKYYNQNDCLKQLKEMEDYFVKNEKEIRYSIVQEYYTSENLIFLDKKIKEMKEEQKELSRITDYELLSKFVSNKKLLKSKPIVESLIIEIKECKEEYSKKKIVIDTLQKGNIIIEALSDITKNQEGIFKFKEKGNNQCPLCSSEEKFPNITKKEIGSLALEYLKLNDCNIANFKVELNDLNKILEGKIEKIKEIINSIYSKQIQKGSIKMDEYVKSYDTHTVFFEKLKLNNIEINNTCCDSIRKKRELINQNLEEEEIIKKIKKILVNTLTVLNVTKQFSLDNEKSLNDLTISISSFCNKLVKNLEFDFDLFNKKVVNIKQVMNHKVVIELQNELNQLEETNKKIKKDIESIEKNIKSIDDVIKKVKNTKKDLEKEELENVGPYLAQIFSKMVKHSNIGTIKLKRNNALDENSGGIVLLDDNNANLLNILSQGQLGILMMSYFFANMFRRKKELTFKTYFVDDITSCLDDMNIISFIDMIKYLLNRENGVMNQMFFSTCDDNLEKLFIHKMKSFNINGTNIKFKSYSDYTCNKF